MKNGFFIFAFLALAGGRTSAVTASFGASGLGATITDGDLSGYQSSFLVSGFTGPITDVNFSLDLSGGFNGDYYAYLTHGTTSAILLNRTGRSNSSDTGYSDAGFAITLDDQASTDVHFYRSGSFSLASGRLVGTWQPDGRAIDPLASGNTFSGASRADLLNAFNGLDPNGTWTFFIADIASGSEGVLNGYSVQITAIPEPALLTFSQMLTLTVLLRRRLERGASHD